VPHQAGRTQSARENVRIPVAPARRDARHPVRFEKSSSRALKKSCGTPKDKTRLYMNVGEEMNIAPEDVVNAILGETGLPRQVVGKVDVRERHLFADVASEHAHAIIGRLNRSDIKGRRIKVKLA
jgi:ATP-dependent RNA helicase DeaD